MNPEKQLLDHLKSFQNQLVNDEGLSLTEKIKMCGVLKTPEILLQIMNQFMSFSEIMLPQTD